MSSRRLKLVTPQPWKPGDLETEDFEEGGEDEPTMQVYVPDPDLFMEDLEKGVLR